MIDPRIEQVARALCKANGINPDCEQLRLDGGHERMPMWEAYIVPAKEHIAAFDVLYGGASIDAVIAESPFYRRQK